ncbi:unnamed protein product, partial [Ixodes persulcatus]
SAPPKTGPACRQGELDLPTPTREHFRVAFVTIRVVDKGRKAWSSFGVPCSSSSRACGQSMVESNERMLKAWEF